MKSFSFLDKGASFHAEMGDMSYISLQHRGLVDFITEVLNLETEKVPEEDSAENNDNLFYLRGKYMRRVHSADKAKDFYDLLFHEKNYTPKSLLYKAIEAIVPNAFTLNDTAWEHVITSHKFNGEYLYNLGFNNVLSHVVSQEALRYIQDATSLFSPYFDNPNALDAIISIVSMSKGIPKKPIGGMQAIIQGLADRFVQGGGKIIFNRQLIGMDQVSNISHITENVTADQHDDSGNTSYTLSGSDGTIFLQFTDTRSPENITDLITSRYVIFALPPEQLSSAMAVSPYFANDTVKGLLSTVNQVPNSKLYLCYEYPWWQNLGHFQGQSLTDLPIRETHYLQSGCIVASVNTGSRASYWMALNETAQFLEETQRGRLLSLDLIPATSWMIKEAQRELQKLHNVEFIPSPTLSAFIDSSMTGDYKHFFKVGVHPKITYESSLKPLSDWNVFFIGESFAFPRLFLESEFSSAEDVIQKFFLQPIHGEYDSIEAIIIQNRTRIGTSISASADGRRLAVVSYGHDGVGSVAVFQYNGDNVVGKWSISGDLFGTDYNKGFSEDKTSVLYRAANNESIVTAAISGDGNTVAIGVVQVNDLFGYVQVYHDTGNDNWTQIGTDMFDDYTNSSFGAALSLSYAGEKLAVGAPDFDNHGRVFIYECNYNECNQLGIPIDGFGVGFNFGHSVSLSAQGNVIAIGAPSNRQSPGYAVVFRYHGGYWHQHGNKLPNVELDETFIRRFGWALSLSGDGTRLAVGSPDSLGQVYVYLFDGEWKDESANLVELIVNKTHAENITNLTETYDFGFSLALSYNGRFLIIGCPQIESNSSGLSVVYQYSNGLWMSHGDLLSGVENGEMFGYSVAINVDGSFIAIGAPGSYGSGSVWTYNYQEEPLSSYNKLAREIWVNATKNTTVGYPWDLTNNCILFPEVMASYGGVPSSKPVSTPISSNTTYAPTSVVVSAAVAPSPSSTNNTARLNENFPENDAGKAYYASLAQGIIGALENNSTTADVAQALLFQVNTTSSSSECISLLDAAKTLVTTSHIVPNDLRAGIESAIKIFSSRVKDTPMKLNTSAPIASPSFVEQTLSPLNVETTTSSPTRSPAAGIKTLAPFYFDTTDPIGAFVSKQPTSMPFKVASSAPNLSPSLTSATETFAPFTSDTTAPVVSTSVPVIVPSSAPTKAPVCPPSPPIISYNAVSFKVILRAPGWIGLGVSERGEMAGSVAVIGIPERWNDVFKYNLNSKEQSGVVKMENSMQTLRNFQILQSPRSTVLMFQTLLDWNNGTLSFNQFSDTNMIYAFGYNNTFGYHGPQHRGSFLLNLSLCSNALCKTDASCVTIDANYDQQHVLVGDPYFAVLSKLINL